MMTLQSAPTPCWVGVRGRARDRHPPNLCFLTPIPHFPTEVACRAQPHPLPSPTPTDHNPSGPHYRPGLPACLSTLQMHVCECSGF